VPPGATPDTIPVAPTVATLVLLLLQLPPGVVLASVIVLPSHTCDGPVIAEGGANTVTVIAAAQLAIA
jgi:hypothetical protein